MPSFLRLIREPSVSGATLGSLYVDGVWNCWTLEDEIREVAGQFVAEWKVPKVTAIPVGTYLMQITLSQRYGRLLPLLTGVPGFTGIRIHTGNTDADTEGCILVGRVRREAQILESRLAFKTLFDHLKASERSIISIEAPV